MILVGLLLLEGCRPTRRVVDGSYLLEDVDIEVEGKGVMSEELEARVQQRPNKRIVGARFHLWLYNKSDPEKDNWWHRWLRKNGEEPVLYNELLSQRTCEQMRIHLENKGYYYSDVRDSVRYKRKRAYVKYYVEPGWAYRVNSIRYDIADTLLGRIVLRDSTRTLLKEGMLFDADQFDAERKRIEQLLQNAGYYRFKANDIHYEVDSAYNNRTVSVVMEIPLYEELEENGNLLEMPHKRYRVRNVEVNAGSSMEELLRMNAKAVRDSVKVSEDNRLRIRLSDDFPISERTIAQGIYVKPDSLYSLRWTNITYLHFQGLQNFRQVSVDYRNAGEKVGGEEGLDCVVNLLQLKRRNLLREIEATTSSEGNLGGGVGVKYQDRSLFGHAEIFEFRLRGLIEAVKTDSSSLGFKSKLEFEGEASLNIPRFLMLGSWGNSFSRIYNKKTVFSVLYNYQRRPELYERKVFSTSVGYSWRRSRSISHMLKPLDINFVQLPYVSPRFDNYLNKYPFLQNSYQTHMVVSSSYMYARDMHVIDEHNYIALRVGVETAGLLLRGLYSLFGETMEDGEPYKMFGNAFSQFVKMDADLRHHWTIQGDNRLVSRMFVGVGVPYGNSRSRVMLGDGSEEIVASMPFEKKFYAGGANSMRGWQLRALGPGSYRDSLSYAVYPNNTGDLKLEANLEYRFKIVGMLEGTLFADAGNVWDLSKDSRRKGADFAFNRFYKEIGLSGGVGLRADFGYFVLRLDLGMKLRDPMGAGRWAFSVREGGESRVKWDDFNLSIGIGYPFL